jgi:hypothetical protein
LVLSDSLVSENETSGRGGGVFARRGSSTVRDTVIQNNTAGGNGGGAVFDSVDLLRASIADNHTTGSSAHGGGAFVQASMKLTDSTVSGNYTLGSQAKGGGIYSFSGLSNVAVTSARSTISGNYTIGTDADGGGIFLRLGGLELNDSTISGNRTLGESADGGGIFGQQVTAARSTIVHNSASGTASAAGGIAAQFGFNSLSSILALNTASAASPDVKAQSVSATATLIGDTSGAPAFNPASNLLNLDPRIGPLVDNGGPTLTHALLPGSPAMDRGPVSLSAPQFDQRGAPWLRIVDGDGSGGARIDIGSVELQPNPLSGDYNFNGIVDAADYVLWRKLLASTTDLRADGSGNAAVDQPDYDLWQSNFGNTAPSPASDSAFGSISGLASHAVASVAYFFEPDDLDIESTSRNAVISKAQPNEAPDTDELLATILRSRFTSSQPATDKHETASSIDPSRDEIDVRFAVSLDRAFALLGE